MFDYSEYVRLFNVGDDLAHTERFFADDFAFVGSSRMLVGKQNYLKFLAFAHDGVLERMRPQRIVRDGDYLFVDMDMDFHATKTRNDNFPFGNMEPGDLITVKFFVTYQINTEGKVQVLKAMTWAPGKGVSSIPRLGSHPSQMAAFQAYLAAFSNADFKRFTAFYQDDVILTLNDGPALEGKAAIVGFYDRMFAQVRETLTLTSMEATDTSIQMRAVARFTAQADAPDFLVTPMVRGEVVDLPVEVDYELRDGLIQRIQTRRSGEPRKVALAAAAV